MRSWACPRRIFGRRSAGCESLDGFPDNHRRRGPEGFAGNGLRQVSVRGSPLFQIPLWVLHRLIATDTTDKLPPRHAFISSLSICYLADIGTIAEWSSFRSPLSTRPVKIPALKPSKFQPTKTSRPVSLNQIFYELFNPHNLE